MFTGIIHSLGSVVSTGPLRSGSGVLAEGGTVRLDILPDAVGRAWKPRVGDSIAVDGCCLTLALAPKPGKAWVFHVVPETLRKTTLGGLVPGARVHLERAAGAQTLLDGHMVQGHVDAVARVVSIQTGDDWRIRVSPPDALMAYIIPKGSVCLAGVSLTVAELGFGGRSTPRQKGRGWFEVALIPTTLERTHLRDAKVGGGLNVECDPIAKTVVHYLRHALRGVDKSGASVGDGKKPRSSRRG